MLPMVVIVCKQMDNWFSTLSMWLYSSSGSLFTESAFTQAYKIRSKAKISVYGFVRLLTLLHIAKTFVCNARLVGYWLAASWVLSILGYTYSQPYTTLVLCSRDLKICSSCLDTALYNSTLHCCPGSYSVCCNTIIILAAIVCNIIRTIYHKYTLGNGP